MMFITVFVAQPTTGIEELLLVMKLRKYWISESAMPLNLFNLAYLSA
jgi:hypothetical protein